MPSLSGRTALVTGAAGGIGRELVRALLRAGAHVIAADIADARLEELASMMAGEGLAERLAGGAQRRMFWRIRCSCAARHGLGSSGP